MGKGRGDPTLDVIGSFDPDAADSRGFGNRGEVRISELSPRIQEPGRFLLELDVSQGCIFEYESEMT
jgi:hypothetical protein